MCKPSWFWKREWTAVALLPHCCLAVLWPRLQVNRRSGFRRCSCGSTSAPAWTTAGHSRHAPTAACPCLSANPKPKPAAARPASQTLHSGSKAAGWPRAAHARCRVSHAVSGAPACSAPRQPHRPSWPSRRNRSFLAAPSSPLSLYTTCTSHCVRHVAYFPKLPALTCAGSLLTVPPVCILCPSVCSLPRPLARTTHY